MLDTINSDIYLTPEELAKRFKLSLSSVYKLVRSGEIPSIRLGKVYRIPESDLNAYVARQKGGVGPFHIPSSAVRFLELLEKSPLKEKVNEVYLFGSSVRGDYDEDSDIDLCVVIDRLDLSTRKTVMALSEKAMAAVDYGELLSVKLESRDSWERMKRDRYPLVQAILREGHALWEKRRKLQ